ncbi:MAG: hypothetical protein R2795_05305 [Saprospiraceae bacterium]
MFTTNNHYYDIEDSPSGSYTISVADANGCVNVQQIEVQNITNTLQVGLTPQNGSCGGTGSISVSISGGNPWYTVAWYRNGQPSGSGHSGFYRLVTYKQALIL